MPYPTKAFRSLKHCDGVVYQDTPSGGLPDFDRFIRGLPCWPLPYSAKKEKNSILILADWTAIHWPRLKVKQVIKAFRWLMTAYDNGLNEGFTIYLHQNEELHLLTDANLGLLYDEVVRDQLMPSSMEDVLIKAVAQLKIAADDIHILDNYWVEYLLSEEETQKPRTLKFTDYFNYLNYPSKCQEVALQLMKQASPPVSEIIIDTFAIDCKDKILALKAIFPKCTLTRKPHTMASLNHWCVQQLLAGNTVTDLLGTSFSLSDIKHITSLYIDCDSLGLTEIEGILAQATHLSCLSLNQCNVPLASIHLAALGYLYLSNSILEWNSIKECTHLKQVTINNSSLGLGEAPEATLPALKKFIIVCEEAFENDEYKRRLFKIAPKLDEIESKITPKRNLSLEQPPKKKANPLVNPMHATKPEIKKTPAVSSRRFIDADTHFDPKATYRAEELFKPLNHSKGINPLSYRKTITQKIHPNPKVCAPKHAFIQTNEGAFDFINPHIKRLLIPIFTEQQSCSERLLFHSKQQLKLSRVWQPIVSLSAYETLHEIYCKPTVWAEIKYSRRDNLYYIRSNKCCEVTIEFRVSIPKENPPLPEFLTPVIDMFTHFGAGRLLFDPKRNYSGEDYFAELITQKKGSCRHRAVAFALMMAKEHPLINVRCVGNGIHMFAEIRDEKGYWHHCDLGGYPIKLTTIPFCESGSIPIIRDNPSILRKKLRTWVIEKMDPIDKESYLKECFTQSTIKKRLIECQSPQELNGISILLQWYAQKTHTPLFYVHAPHDLVCKAPYVDESGALCPGPGGSLYRFLTTHAKGILLINYQHVDTTQLVRLNSMLDKVRLIDGIEIPKEFTLIGIRNRAHANCYLGSDFISRFDRVEVNPLTQAQWESIIPALPQSTPVPADGASFVINLFRATNWREQLVGFRTFNEAGILQFKDGLLKKAFASGKKIIELHHGLWDEHDFLYFWQSVLTLRAIATPEGLIELPEGICFIRKDEYEWRSLKPWIASATHPSELALNPSTFSNFFEHFTLDDGGRPKTKIGVIAAAATNIRFTISVLLTQALTEDMWAKLLYECMRYGVKLNVTNPCFIHMPQELQTKVQRRRKANQYYWHKNIPLSPMLAIYSTDTDTTAALIAKEKDWLILDATELRGSELLKRIESTFDEHTLSFTFKEEKCVLTKALDNNQRVILKGVISQALAEELAELILQRQANLHARGTLVLINESNTTAYANPFFHQVTREEQIACLSTDETMIAALDPFLEKESLAQLICRRDWLLAHPKTTIEDSKNAWRGLFSVPEGFKLSAELNPETSAQEAALFMEHRLREVECLLYQQPYVLLRGFTGVGKTTFVHHHLCRPTDTLFLGVNDMEKWACATGPGRKLLFIDDYDTNSDSWSCFEGLFNIRTACSLEITPPIASSLIETTVDDATRPYVLIAGQYYPLTDEHKVIFAGKPKLHPNHKKEPSLFVRHANSIWFDILPLAMIYETIIKPVFSDTPLAQYTSTISLPLVDIYYFLIENTDKEVLITPQEVQMIALMVLSLSARLINLNEMTLSICAAHIAYQLAQTRVPEARKADFALLCQPKEALPPLIINLPPKIYLDYTHTPSRLPVIGLLADLLALRELRKKSPHDVLRYGGLGGLILEGEPGIGKSELISACLEAQGFIPYSAEALKGADNLFYRLPVSWPLEDKKKLLLQAFHQGAIVLIDEINSDFGLGNLLRELLAPTFRSKIRNKIPNIIY